MTSEPTPTPAHPTSSHSSDAPPFRYTAALAQQIESHWQNLWEQQKTFATPNPGEPGFEARKPKKFILDMFPYPSGAGLHVGHPLGYIATDITARYHRMTGHNVLHAMGFDAFGLPAEQFAVQNNIHPRVAVERNIASMRSQLRRLGLAHDPRRSASTTDESFYRWTQWIFLKAYNSWYDADADRARPIEELVGLYAAGTRVSPDKRAWATLNEDERRTLIDDHRLAFLAEVPVNWCPMLGTVLANEEVTVDGRSERGNYPVFKRPLKQWMMRITSYAERLLNDLDGVDWPEKVKIMQRNWIGRSEGAVADFACSTRRIRVFTTRPDTIFGATYIVLSPEHEMVDFVLPEKYAVAPSPFTRAIFPGADSLLSANASPREVVDAYRAFAASRTDQERTDGKLKTGVFTGAFALNPVNDARVPVFIADYVLSGYGTGAIMAVPAHDERDFEFAKAFNLPIKDVVYTRQLAAMAYYAKHAGDATGAAPAQWREELADFLGVVTSESTEHRSHEQVLMLIRKRRDPASRGVIVSANADAPGSIGERRGVVRAFWIETLDELEITDFAEFVDRFAKGEYASRRGEALTTAGIAANSSSAKLTIDGLDTPAAKQRVAEYLAKQALGKATINFRLRDWLFSRQRYWGEPFPIVFDERGRAHALPESMLPVTLPHMDNFQPNSSEDAAAPVVTPLGRATDWVTTTLDLGDGPREYTRETNTMPNWAGSCWYFLRYLDPSNETIFCDPAVERYWMSGADGQAKGVDLYVGGVEHAVLHLLYARFWHKMLFDLGYVSTREPFAKLFNQGYIQGFAFKDSRGVYVDAFNVRLPDGTLAFENQDKDGPFTYEGQPVTREYGKMGKSLKNAVAPDYVCDEYGCDTLRIYEMSMGPLEASKPWNTRDIAGAYRFLQRLWRNLIDEQTGIARVSEDAAPMDLRRALHKTIKGVRHDMVSMGFNTSVAKLIEFNNLL
ncbi:MAG: leucine--tRNA ligase, partial [Phycisphaerales bacterium]|nr:leucine--tRNA ligase [Phycisphaerales bacterium]